MKNNNITTQQFKLFGGVEKIALVAIFLLSLGNFLINQNEIAQGIIIGGLIFIADFIVIKFLVNSILLKRYPIGFSVFLFVIKLLILLLLLVTLLIFAKLNIYGFIIALTAVVIVIIGSGLRGI